MIIVVFGLPGTGKSYFSKHFAEKLNAEYVNTDEIRYNMNKMGEYDNETKQLIYNQLMKEVKKRLQFASNVIVDGTFHERSKRNQIKTQARKLNQRTVFIELKSNDSLAKKRLKKKREFSEADYKVYQQIKSKFEPLQKPHLELLSNNRNVNELVDKAKNFIYE